MAGTPIPRPGISPTGYIVYRSTTPHGAKIKASAQNMQDILVAEGDYMIVDGFEIDGGNLGLTSNAFSYGTGLLAGGHHFQALNNLIHDCGAAGIAANEKDWYVIQGNTVYNNSFFSPFHSSGIVVYEARKVSFTATAADNAATYHIIVQNNVAHDNFERYVPEDHSDGNGIILDDFKNTQTTNVAYPYKSLIQNNTSYDNGGSGIHVFETDNVTVTNNIAFTNNLDAAIASNVRGELFNGIANNNTWTNNQAAATSLTSGWERYNVAVLDGSSTNVVWTNNANIDTRTGARSYQIDNAARAAAFPANNPLGKRLTPSS
jgi:parallel beta-helix repeat protein